MKLQYDAEAVRRFCHERGIARLELFGSALRDEQFRPDSDVDLLCTLEPGKRCGLFDWVAMQQDLENLFGRRVDLLSRAGIERSRNRRRKQGILARTEILYGEG